MSHLCRNFLVEQIASISQHRQTLEPQAGVDPYEGRELCVPELVAAQAEAAPNALAVSQGKVSLTYKELNERASRLAGFLRSSGVGPDPLVPIYLNPPPPILVAALGILKAAGAP